MPSITSGTPKYLLAILVAIVIAIYIWFYTAGLWTAMPKAVYTQDYDLLATAFTHGHLSLDVKPSPGLLALSDPYDPKQRRNISYIGDLSLYENNLYLYWGPVPSFVLAGIKLLGFHGTIGDEYIVLTAAIGLFLWLTLLILKLKEYLFNDTPGWLVCLAVITAGLAGPFTWMLNNPIIYEAAILAGQFFFVGGIYWIVTAVLKESRPSLGRIAAGSIFWALAIGSRFTQILAIAFLIVIIVIWLYSKHYRGKALGELGIILAILVIPQVLAGLGIAWYNFARFGSILEFGLRYQLAFVNMHRYYHQIFSPAYIVPNLYNYLINPYALSSQFPFLIPHYGRLFRDSLNFVPTLYFSEAITGLLISSPVILVAGYTSARSIKNILDKNKRAIHMDELWMIIGLTGSAVIEAVILFSFFDASTRYIADFIPPVILLEAIGIFELYRRFRGTPRTRIVITTLVIALSVISIMSNSLLAVSSDQHRFQTGNPALMKTIHGISTDSEPTPAGGMQISDKV